MVDSVEEVTVVDEVVEVIAADSSATSMPLAVVEPVVSRSGRSSTELIAGLVMLLSLIVAGGIKLI